MMSHGHIVLSFAEFKQDARKWHVDKFTAERVEHAILAHHSRLSWGSPVKPITPEARMVCACDLLSSQLAKGKSNYFYDFLMGTVKTGDEKEVWDEDIKPWMDAENKEEQMQKQRRKVRDALRKMDKRDREEGK